VCISPLHLNSINTHKRYTGCLFPTIHHLLCTYPLRGWWNTLRTSHINSTLRMRSPPRSLSAMYDRDPSFNQTLLIRCIPQLSIALPVIYSESKGWLKMMSEEGEMRRLVLGGTNDVQTKCLLEDKVGLGHCNHFLANKQFLAIVRSSNITSRNSKEAWLGLSHIIALQRSDSRKNKVCMHSDISRDSLAPNYFYSSPASVQPIPRPAGSSSLRHRRPNVPGGSDSNFA